MQSQLLKAGTMDGGSQVGPGCYSLPHHPELGLTAGTVGSEGKALQSELVPSVLPSALVC